MSKMIEDLYNEAELFAQPSNPLAKYFRLPGLSVKLPSAGRYNDIELAADGTVEVYPMTSADELLLNSPDALMSGAAVERLIQSCVPALKNPKALTVPDLDVLLLAIRAASSGNNMPVEVECPECGTASEFDCHLPDILTTMSEISEDDTVRLTDELLVTVKPHVLATQTKILVSAFHEQRKAQAVIENPDATEEERQAVMSEVFTKVAALEAEVTAEAIVQISTPDAIVTDKRHIHEFLKQTSKGWMQAIKGKIDEMNVGIDKTFAVECPRETCKKQWRAEVSFDPSTFFGRSSSD